MLRFYLVISVYTKRVVSWRKRVIFYFFLRVKLSYKENGGKNYGKQLCTQTNHEHECPSCSKGHELGFLLSLIAKICWKNQHYPLKIFNVDSQSVLAKGGTLAANNYYRHFLVLILLINCKVHLLCLRRCKIVPWRIYVPNESLCSKTGALYNYVPIISHF